MSSTRAIIFDNGNVLEGPLPSFNKTLADLAAEHGFATGHDLWLHIYISEAWEQAKRGRISVDAFWAERVAALGVRDYLGFRAALFAHRSPRPDMIALIHELRTHYRLAVLSNTAFPDLKPQIDPAICDDFDLIVSSAAVGVAKPEPEIYQITLERLGVAPHEALFIDDLKRNTDAAEALGIPSVVFTSVATLKDELMRRGCLAE